MFCSQAEDVVEGALAKEWFTYPLPLQKNLLIILMMAQRPVQVDFYGLYPLNNETFYSVSTRIGI